VLTLVIIVQYIAGLPGNEPTFVLGDSASFSQNELLAESNKVRHDHGVALLAASDRLNKAATLKAEDMINRQYWSHDAPDGTTPWYWFRAVNYRYIYAGENLAKGFDTPAAVITAWMNSPEHRENALSPDYQDVGFGVADGKLLGEQTKVVVALYGTSTDAQVKGQGQVLAAHDGNLSLLARFGAGLQSLDAAGLGSLILLALCAFVALLTHAYRKQLPKSVQKSWKRHHAFYTFLSLVLVMVGLILLYGGGQII
jgi:hypothetical protein